MIVATTRTNALEDGNKRAKQIKRPYLVFQTVSDAIRFLWFGGGSAHSFLCLGVSYLVTQIELCFFAEVSHFPLKSELEASQYCAGTK